MQQVEALRRTRLPRSQRRGASLNRAKQWRGLATRYDQFAITDGSLATHGAPGSTKREETDSFGWLPGEELSEAGGGATNWVVEKRDVDAQPG